MRKILPYAVWVVALAATLSACTSSQVDAVRAAANGLCGVLPSVASTTALVATGQPLAGMAAEAAAKMICNAYKNRLALNATEQAASCPKVGGVCVWADKVDIQKLKDYK